jgi:UDP-hydrolysing UDP-N-acetyl-D-glucosamine 2-epimerase
VTRVLSVSSSRADVGILGPVWAALAACDGVELHVFLTGMHRAADAPPTDDIPAGARVHEGGADLGGDTGSHAADAIASITRSAADVYAEVVPDLVLVTGDRLDMLPAAVASLPFNLPLAHLHGGEVTEGAVDDRVRHAITKLAHLHCVASEGARARLRAMGEEDWRITVTGAPGLDTLKAAPEMSAADLAAALDLPDVAGLRLVTVHPETNADDPLAPLDAVLGALAARPAPTLFTAPNSDPGGAEMRRRLDAFVAANDWAHFRDTLGSRLYPNALRQAVLMVGNSSSGVIEAGLFGLPVIDVGGRQMGRERGENVVTVPSDAKAVIAALDSLGPTPARAALGTPYGDGASGPRVAEAVAAMPSGRGALVKRSPMEPR